MEEIIIDKLEAMDHRLNVIEQRIIELKTDEFFTVREACEFAKMSRTKFNELKNDGLIEVFKVRGKLLIKRSELTAFIESTSINNQAQRA